MAGINLRRSLFGGNDIAIDLGTANTLIYVKGVGVMVDEPTLIAVNKEDGSILTVGEEAKKLVGRVPDSIKLVKPLRDGVISEIEMAEELVKTLLTRAIGRSYSRPRIVMCVPNGVTSVEQRSIETAAHGTGASEVYTVEEPMAASIGAGLQIYEPFGNMVIDIGGGTTEIAVIALAGIVCDKSVKIAGDVFTEDIVYYMRTQHNLSIGDRTAEKIKINIGSALDELDNPPEDMLVQGRDLLSGKPKEISIGYREIAKALDKSIIRIEESVMETLSQTPPELAADIYNTGIYLAGGGSMLRGLDKRISKKTDLPVFIAEDPLRAVVRGTGITLKNIERYRSVLVK